MEISNTSRQFAAKSIDKIEEHYNAKYVCETSFGKRHYPVTIFYQEEPHPRGSNWFGLFYDYSFPIVNPTLMVCNALKATELVIDAIECNGMLYYSRYGHDFVQTNCGAIGGGRDYTRLVGYSGPVYKLKIVKDKLEIINEVPILPSAGQPNSN